MDQIYPDDTLIPYLKKQIGTGGVDYHLYTNNITPNLSTTLASLIEAAWAGYAVQNVAFATWALYAVSSHLGSTQAPPISFANTSGASVQAYGYFMTDHNTGDFMGVARFDSAPVGIPNGGTYPVVPILAINSALSS